jgi:hypothetical protein
LVIGLSMITATFLNLSVTALTSMYPAEKLGMDAVESIRVGSRAAFFARKRRATSISHRCGGLPTVVALRNWTTGAAGADRRHRLHQRAFDHALRAASWRS